VAIPYSKYPHIDEARSTFFFSPCVISDYKLIEKVYRLIVTKKESDQKEENKKIPQILCTKMQREAHVFGRV